MTFRKLLLLNASTTALMVVLLAIHFPNDELAAARAELERKGSAYSRALADQIAQSGTAAFDSVARDPAIGKVLLLTAAEDEVPLPAVPEPYVLEFSDRIAFVRSVAGSTLVVEYSTASLARARTEQTRTAIAGGLGALALGLMLAFALRRIGRTLEVRAAREHALEVVVLAATPANDTQPAAHVQPAPHARTG